MIFADDVAGGHGLKCLVMVAKIAVIMNHCPRAFTAVQTP